MPYALSQRSPNQNPASASNIPVTPHPTLGPEPATSGPSNLQLRLLTAAVALPILAALTWVGGWPFALVAGVVALLAAAEFTHGWLFPTMPFAHVLPQAPVFGIAGVAVAASHWDERAPVAAAVFAVLLALAGFAPTNALGPRRPYRVQAGALLYLGVLLSSLVLLRDLEDGRDWVFLAILATFAVDTGAYATGKLIGRHKLAPQISPGKTWEGVAGGFIAGAAAVVALAFAFDIDPSLARLLPLAFLLPPLAMGGDLFESWMKRRMGVKDASGLLPGHGGFLDRLDSLLFVAPLVYLFVRAFVL